MATYSVSLDASTDTFYRAIAAHAALPVQTVLADALFKLAGELSLEALNKKK